MVKDAVKIYFISYGGEFLVFCLFCLFVFNLFWVGLSGFVATEV